MCDTNGGFTSAPKNCLYEWSIPLGSEAALLLEERGCELAAFEAA